jgi:hypothetical protein
MRSGRKNVTEHCNLWLIEGHVDERNLEDEQKHQGLGLLLVEKFVLQIQWQALAPAARTCVRMSD